MSLVPGTQATLQVTYIPVHGFSGAVTLTSGPLPPGITLSPALPQPIPPSGLNLTVTAAPDAPLTFSTIVSFSATSGSVSTTRNLSFVIKNRAGITLGVPATRVDLARGNTTTILFTVIADNGIADFTEQLQASTPSGVTASFDKNTVSPTDQVNLTLTADPSAPSALGKVTITATSSLDGGQVQASFPLFVGPAPGTIPGNRTNWIRTKANPNSAYFDPTANRVYVGLPSLNRVDVIDVPTGNLLASIPVSVVGLEPTRTFVTPGMTMTPTSDGKSLLVLGAGHISTIDLASMEVVARTAIPAAVPVGRSMASILTPRYMLSAIGGHILFAGGDAYIYNWDGSSALASRHSWNFGSFDRNHDGSRVLTAAGGTSGAYELLDVVSDTVIAQGAYPNAFVWNVRGNPAIDEWAFATSDGIDFRDSNLQLIASTPLPLFASVTYGGMTYSADGKYLYVSFFPGTIPFLLTFDTATHTLIRVSPSTGTDIAYFRRVPPVFPSAPVAADNSGLVFALSEKGLAIDDATYSIDPAAATLAVYHIIATPDNGPVDSSTSVKITTQWWNALPDVWFGSQRASSASLDYGGTGQLTATAPPGTAAGPVNIKIFPPDGYTYVMPQAFTYGVVIDSIQPSVCPAAGACSTDVYGFGLFSPNGTPAAITIGGRSAPVSSIHYVATEKPYPYPLEHVTVTVPAGAAGRADVAVQSSSGGAVAHGAFSYATSLQSFASSQPYNALLYDPRRDILYASTDTQIARFSVASASFLAPITPPSVNGKYRLQAMSLSPDRSHLFVANQLDGSVAIIDPDNPSSAQAVSIPVAPLGDAGPWFVAATSTSKVLIGLNLVASANVHYWSGPLYLLDLNSLQITSAPMPLQAECLGCWLSPTRDGSRILVRGGILLASIWDATTEQFTPLSANFPNGGIGVAAGDANVYAVGNGFVTADGASSVAFATPDELGGSESFLPTDEALDDSGALGFAVQDQKLLVFDSNHGDVLRSLKLPNPVTLVAKTVAVDSAGQHVFIVDSQGLTAITFASAPLALATVSPSSLSVNGGDSVTLRGTGFQASISAMINGKAAVVSFVDSNTLRLSAPANPTGAATISLTNPDGESYTLQNALHYQ